MARTFIASDPRSGKHEALIEVRPDLLDGAAPADIERFKCRLYERHIHAGMLITPRTAHLISDSFTSVEFSSESYDVKVLPTGKLFSRVDNGVEHGEGLYVQVRRWLEAVGRSWWSSVPDEALSMMLPAMIGLAEADLEEYEDLSDAA
ncbi:hypothetical protein WME98_22520 [Sorangium sp. So ce296]|uniref:Uncharacterized protein n=1 Tax=Sorangium cellulosum TaxID=56 RepID=A0A150U2Y6_SORCE|nr:hypothetical protein BE21_57965 [Sorangium cellulosum]